MSGPSVSESLDNDTSFFGLKSGGVGGHRQLSIGSIKKVLQASQ